MIKQISNEEWREENGMEANFGYSGVSIERAHLIKVTIRAAGEKLRSVGKKCRVV